MAAKRRPSLTAARHGGAIELRSGRKNGFAEGRTEKCTVQQFSCQLFVFKLNEGANGVSIAIYAQKHRVQASIYLLRLRAAGEFLVE